jgi:sulfite reductase (NADPH) hemoprotein beta-component
MNGLYMQRHAYMLRIAIPYGLLRSEQVRKLAFITERYDRGYGHVTTRQNLQLNWIKLEEAPDILRHLADVEMHAIQTSGNCVRNVTSDPFAGIASDELIDPRPWCELLRQYSTLHPEFLYLPRKFKIAISGSREDRAATSIHDIGLRAVLAPDGSVAWRVYAGGGLGRTPRIGQVVRDFLPLDEVTSYCEAILRVYNLYGRRDNKFKARIKILVGELGLERFRAEVEAEYALVAHRKVDMEQVRSIAAQFDDVVYDPYAAEHVGHQERHKRDLAFARWMTQNVAPHKVPGYNAVYLSLKRKGVPTGDLFTHELYKVADLMDRYNQGYCSTTYSQNLLFQYVKNEDLPALYDELSELGLATPNIGTIHDIICCPGLDFCSLANAVSIPVSKAIIDRFADLDEAYDVGPLEIKMSGCINACGHHHVGHIGILGIDKHGESFYQLEIGGSPGTTDDDPPSVGTVLGAAVAQDDVVTAIDRIVEVYVARRSGTETFIETVRRLGVQPFKEAVYV